MFTLQVGFLSPSFVGIVPSIEMVICAAVGGRASLFGAIYGSLLVNFGKTYFSETFPELWLFVIGALFIAVVMVFPDGVAGIDVRGAIFRLVLRLRGGSKPKRPAPRLGGDPSKPRLPPEPPGSDDASVVQT
jgi:urea transport system permease protein